MTAMKRRSSLGLWAAELLVTRQPEEVRRLVKPIFVCPPPVMPSCFLRIIGTLKFYNLVYLLGLSAIYKYIEFYEVMSVPIAIGLSGQPLLGQVVMFEPFEAEKN